MTARNDQQHPPRVPEPGRPGRNVADLIRRAAAEHPDRPAVLGAGGPRTWAEVDAAVDAGVRDLRRRGLAPGERIVVALPTGADLALTLLVCARAGAVAVPTGPHPDAIAAVADRVDAFGAVATDRPTGFPLALDHDRVARWWTSPPGPAERPGAGGEDLAWLARPFGDRLVMLSHRAIGAAVTALLALDPGLRDADRLLQVLPLHHLSGWVTTFLPVAGVGGAAVFPAVPLDGIRASGRPESGGPTIDGVLRAAAEHRVTVISGAAPFFHQLTAGRGDQEIVDRLSTVRLLTSGVPPFESDDVRTADVLARVAPMWPSYGLAESASVVSTTLVGGADGTPPRPGSAGRPVGGLAIRVSGQELLTGSPSVAGPPPVPPEGPDADRAAAAPNDAAPDAGPVPAARPDNPAAPAGSVGPADATDPVAPVVPAGSVGPAGPAEWDDPLDVLGDAGEIGEVGPIALRGPTLFSGYWPDGRGGPGPDGWWVSRDLGYLDDGELFVVDRAGGVLRVTGFPVYPLEVEQELLTHPLVRAAAVVGERTGRSALSGSRVVAVVVLDEQPPGSADVAGGGDPEVARVLAEHLADRLPPFKRPVAYHFVAELPLTDVGRVDRVAARRRYASAPGITVPRLSVVPAAPSAAPPAALPAGAEAEPEVSPEPVGDLDDLGTRLPASGDRSDRGRQDTDDDLF